jgi:hypothetical protein
MDALERTGQPAVITVAGELPAAPSARPAIIASIFGALDAAFFFCRPPHIPVPFASGRVLLIRTLAYVLAAALAGAACSVFFWKRSQAGSSRPLTLVALAAAASSVWMPAAVLFFHQDSMWLVPVTALAAAVLATCWRPILPRSSAADAPEPDRSEFFAETLQPLPRDQSAFWITLGIYATGFELSDGGTVTASGLLAICGFAIAWQLTLAVDDSASARTLRKRAALRFLLVTLPALVVTFLALNAWNPTPADAAFAGARIGSGVDASKQNSKKPSSAMGLGLSGYQSVILWPVTEKDRIVAPLPPGTTPNFDRITKPLVFHFDGSYWYFQPPHAAPGPEAQIARGTPLAANVRSTNFNPLVMEAHQKLGTPISLACCSALQVEVADCDNLPGNISLGVTLSNSATAHKASTPSSNLFLGLQTVASTAPSLLAEACSPRTQSFRFPIPSHAPLRKFDEIKVIFVPDPTRSFIGARIALEEFKLLPR